MPSVPLQNQDGILCSNSLHPPKPCHYHPLLDPLCFSQSDLRRSIPTPRGLVKDLSAGLANLSSLVFLELCGQYCLPLQALAILSTGIGVGHSKD